MGDENLREKIPPVLWAGFCFVLLFLGTSGFLLYRSQERQLRRETIDILGSIAELKAGQIAEWRRDSLSDGADDIANPIILRLLRERLTTTTRSTSGEILAVFETQRKNRRYLEVRLVDKEGRTLLAAPARRRTHPRSRRAALETADRERRPVLTRFHFGPTGSSPHIETVVPVFASEAVDAPLLGAVISTIDPKAYFYPLIESWPTPSPSAETLLVTGDGDDVLFLNELRHRKDTALKLRIPLNQAEVPATMAVQGTEGAVEGLDYRGVPVLAVLKKIPDTPWFMVSKIDRAEAFAGWRARAILILGLIFALIAAAAASFLVLWQRRVKAHFRALHEAESARDLSESRYRTTLLSIGDGVILTDPAGRVDFLNPAAERLTGWKPEEARGLPLEKVYPVINADTRLPIDNPVQRVLREGLVVGLANHTLLLSRDGREIPIADSGAPVMDENGSDRTAWSSSSATGPRRGGPRTKFAATKPGSGPWSKSSRRRPNPSRSIWIMP